MRRYKSLVASTTDTEELLNFSVDTGLDIPQREFWITGQIAGVDSSVVDEAVAGRKVYVPNLDIMKIKL